MFSEHARDCFRVSEDLIALCAATNDNVYVSLSDAISLQDNDAKQLFPGFLSAVCTPAVVSGPRYAYFLRSYYLPT